VYTLKKIGVLILVLIVGLAVLGQSDAATTLITLLSDGFRNLLEFFGNAVSALFVVRK
jgi:hypothetical protein